MIKECRLNIAKQQEMNEERIRLQNLPKDFQCQYSYQDEHFTDSECQHEIKFATARVQTDSKASKHRGIAYCLLVLLKYRTESVYLLFD